MIGGSIILPAFSIVTRNQTFLPDYKGHFLAGFCSEENGDCVLYSELPLPAIRFRSTDRSMVVDIKIDSDRCKDEPVSYEGLALDVFDYPELWDLQGLQVWADVYAAKA